MLRGARKLLRSRPTASALIALAIFAAVAVMRQSGILEPLELGAYDWMLRNSPRLVLDDNPIVLIKLREQEIQRYGHPLCDARMALAIAMLLDAGPRGVGIDIYRDIPITECTGREADAPRPPRNTDLAEVATRTDRVVMITKPNEDPPIPPPAFLKGTNQIAVPDIPIDPNGIIRRGLLYLHAGEQAYFSLGLQLALLFLREEGIGLAADPEHPAFMRLGATTIPSFSSNDGAYIDADSGGYQILVDYALGHNGFPSYTLEELYAGEIPEAVIRGKIAILGTESATVKDEFFTPLSAGLANPMLQGMEAHAHLADQLIRFAHGDAQPMASWNTGVEIGWISLWCALGAALGLLKRSVWIIGTAAIAGLAALAVGSDQALKASLWIPFVPPLLGAIATAGCTTAYRAFLEWKEREELMSLFSRFQRPEVADLIWKKKDQFVGSDQRPVSQRLVVTSLMSDLQGYTTASESMDPTALMAWINEYMNTMANLVGDFHGVVDDYAGDGIKANFGYPIPSLGDDQIDRDAYNAVCCGLAMGEAMDRLNESWRERNLPTGRVRVGIFTGSAVVGVIGGDKSMKYTTVGDTVNTAARLESFDKDSFSTDQEAASWRVLVGDGTMKRLGGAFLAEDLGSHGLKGKHEKIEIFRILSHSGAANNEPSEEKTE